MLISESGYKELSDQVYNVEPSKAKSNKKEIIINNSVIIDDVTGQQYRVISAKDNYNDSDTTNDNGMQAMAVVPMVDNQPDYSNITIVYAGTNFQDVEDIKTDINQVVLENKSGVKIQKTDTGYTTVRKEKVWSYSTVKSILSNKQYKGDDLLQKSFTVDFLTKTRK